MNIDWDKVEKDVATFGVEIYPLEECTIGHCLGSGSTMEVFEGKCNINTVTRNVAFKRHMKFKSSTLKQKEVYKILHDFRHEITLMKRLENPTNVVQIYGVTFETKKPVLIVELGNQTLSRYLLDKAESDTPATWHEKVKLCYDISRGIRCLHDAGIVHGNIKCDDVLVFIESTGITTAKLSGFGYFSTLNSLHEDIDISGKNYMAPETRRIRELEAWAKKPTQDIFNFGLVIYQIANDGKTPHENAGGILNADSTNRHTEVLLVNLPLDTPEVFQIMVTSTTRYMPTERASLDTVEKIICDFQSSQQINTHEQAKNTLESFVILNEILDVNKLPIPASFKPNIFHDYRQLAEAGDVFAQFMTGVCWINGFGTEKSDLKAVECFTKAAEAGNGPALNILGFCYDLGRGVTKDLSKAIELYRIGAEVGNPKAQYNLGLLYNLGEGVTKDYVQAAKWYTKSAEANFLLAQNRLGILYESGNGVTKDLPKAFELYKKAAEAGNIIAQCNLGLCYEYGKGVKKDIIKAAELYRKAAIAGNARAQNNLGAIYEFGNGSIKDFRKAFEWYKKGAEGEDHWAQRNLGCCYENGRGVLKNEFKAVEWYTKSTEASNPSGLYNLAYCYENGIGVTKDYVKAIELYIKAEKAGNVSAQYSLNRLKKK